MDLELGTPLRGRPHHRRSSGEDLQPVLLDNHRQLEHHATWSLGAGLPFFNRTFTRIQIASEYRLADVVGFAQLLDLSLLGTARWRASKSRIVTLSSAPTLCNMTADEWIASERPRLILLFLAMTYLHQIPVLQESGDLLLAQRGIAFCEGSEVLQFIILDVCPTKSA